MAENNTPDVSRVLNSIASGKSLEKQLKILNKFFSENDLRAITYFMGEISSKATENMLHARTYLLLLNYPVIYRTFGKKTYDQLMYSLKGSEKLHKIHQVMTQTKSIKNTQIPLLQAKVGIILQILFLLKERITEEGMPPIKINAPDLTLNLINELDNHKSMVVALNDFGKGYWNILVDLLKEADFRSVKDESYELVLTDKMLKLYASGSHLAGSGKGETGQSALSDVMLTRMGRNIVKRISLLLRTVKMYQGTDHPSVTMGLESLHTTFSEVLEHRPSLTFTRLGSDLLIDDVKNRKKEKFVDDFIAYLDERNVNSITMTQGISAEEIRVLITIFVQSPSHVKKAGGVANILTKGGVTNIIVDQFKYGIISADQEEDAEQVSGDEKMVENIIFTELVGRLKDGKGLGDLKAEDVGAAFKQLVSGTFRKDKNAKKTLAQMLMAVDPSLAERALFSKEGFRDDLQWSSARRMIEELITALPKGPPEERMHTLDNLLKMADLAIAKNKDTTLVVITEKIIERLRLRERDLEVAQKVVDILSELCKRLIISGNYQQALEILRHMFQVKNRCSHLPSEKKDALSNALPTIIDRGMKIIDEADAIDVLVNELDSDSLETVDKIVRILEILNTELVVERLLNGFLHDSRSVRNRCFQALYSIGEKTLSVTIWKLKSLNDESMFPRSESGTISDDSYYVLRNCIDLIEKLGKEDQVHLLKEVADDNDPRIRKQIMLSISNMSANEGVFLARMQLTDPDSLVSKAAVNTLGKLKAQGAERDLVDLFLAPKPELHLAIVNSLANIGGEAAENLLSAATHLRFGGVTAGYFHASNELRLAAIKALGQCGRAKGIQVLRKFIRKLKNPLVRIFLFPLQSMRSRKELLKVAQEALTRAEFRMKKSQA